MALGVTPKEIIESGKYPLLKKNKTWNRILLDEVATVQNGYAFESEKFNKKSGTPLIRIRDVGKSNTEDFYAGEYDEDYLVHHGDILIGMDGDFRCAIWSGPEALLNQRVCRVQIESDNYSKKFLYYLLQPYLDAIHAETSSVTVKHLSSKTIKKIPLPHPPLDIQHCIVEKIEELFSDLDNGIENLQKAKQQLETYKQSVLKAAFEGKLTKQWREQQEDLPTPEELKAQIEEERQRYREQQLEEWRQEVKEWEEAGEPGRKPRKPRKAKKAKAFTYEEIDENMPTIPKNWVWEKIANIAQVKGGKRMPKGHSFKEDETNFKYIRAGNLKNLTVTGDLKNIDKSTFKELKRYQVCGKEVYITIVGACIGDTGTIPENLGPAILTENAAKMIGLSSLTPEYLASWISSPYTQALIHDKILSATLGKLALRRIREIFVPIPSLKEQSEIMNQIESKISIVTQLKRNVEEELKRSEALRQSILKKAFEGKLATG